MGLPYAGKPAGTLQVAAVCILLLSVGSAEEYHVAAGGSDRAAGTADAPWRTIQTAADVIQPGDACIVHAGTYRETVRPGRSWARSRGSTPARPSNPGCHEHA